MPESYTLQTDAPLERLNTLHVAATARCLATVADAAALPAALDDAAVRDRPLLVLGEGSNVLFAADFDGVVLRPDWRSVGIVAEDPAGAVVRADAGHGWDALVDWTIGHGLAGLENLALIPGLVGAAPIQNIGAYGVEVREFISCVEAWDRQERRFVRLAGEDCGFGYRDSAFKRDPDRRIVTAVEFRLARSREPVLGYAGVGDELAAMGVDRPGPAQVAAAVRSLRRRKLPDPAVVGNAGSFFKNPVVPESIAARLVEADPALPSHPAGPGSRKLSAAWMIEACGWKGFRAGDAGISDRHALVLVNHGRATGAELLDVARRVADSVERRFDVRLEPEPRIVGAEF